MVPRLPFPCWERVILRSLSQWFTTSVWHFFPAQRFSSRSFLLRFLEGPTLFRTVAPNNPSARTPRNGGRGRSVTSKSLGTCICTHSESLEPSPITLLLAAKPHTLCPRHGFLGFLLLIESRMISNHFTSGKKRNHPHDC